MKLEFNSLEEACEFAYEVKFKALLGSQSAGTKAPEDTVRKPIAKAEKKEEPVEDAAPVQPDPEEPEVTYNLTDVRAKLTELSRAGKTKEVKKLLTEAGASNVSSLDPSKYSEVMTKAGEL